MLELCESDNLGIRYLITGLYIVLERFEDAEKIGKKIKKCERLKEYEEVVRILFDSYTLRGESEC